MSFNLIYDIAGSAMRSQTVRLNTIASNLANANSASATEEGAYKGLKPVFTSIYERLDVDGGLTRGKVAGAKVGILDVVASDRPVDQRYEPGNPLANKDGYVYYSNVNMMEEMADMMSASRSFQTSVEVMGRVNSMQQGLLRLGQM